MEENQSSSRLDLKELTIEKAVALLIAGAAALYVGLLLLQSTGNV